MQWGGGWGKLMGKVLDSVEVAAAVALGGCSDWKVFGLCYSPTLRDYV